MGRPYNTPVDDYYSTSPQRDNLFCELTDEMLACSKEQNGGCDVCKVKERCSKWLDRKTDIGTGYFTHEKLAQCKAEFAGIKASKNGHNGNGHKGG